MVVTLFSVLVESDSCVPNVVKINNNKNMMLRLSILMQVPTGIEHLRLHPMQSMINMQSLINGGRYGEYNNPRHR